MVHGRWLKRWQILPPSGTTSNSTGHVPIGAILGAEQAHGIPNHLRTCLWLRLPYRQTLRTHVEQRVGFTKIADPLFDSGTSIGANVAEAQGGQTKSDFVAKLAIARKESWETIFWLQLAIATSVAAQDEVAWELDEAQQLKAMITAAIKTGQSSNWRGGS